MKRQNQRSARYAVYGGGALIVGMMFLVRPRLHPLDLAGFGLVLFVLLLYWPVGLAFKMWADGRYLHRLVRRELERDNP